MTRVLVIDTDVVGLDFCMRASEAGHEVRLFRYSKKPTKYATGFHSIRLVDDWRAHMVWAREGLILLTANNRYVGELDRFRDLGWRNIFAPTVASARLEIVRSAGMEAMRSIGIEVPPFETFDSLADAEAFARKSDRAWVVKPMGDEEDKSLTYVSKDPADLVGWLQRQMGMGKKLAGKLMLQEKIDRLAEIGVSGWVGPEGFLPDKYQECFEHKPLMDGDVGPATGEQGCYSADTEVLTSDGWKFWPDITGEDELATLVDGSLSFETPSAVMQYDVDGPMIQWTNRSVDILVTPNHNMYVAGQSGARRRCPDFKFVSAEKCTEAQYLLARTADFSGVSPEYFTVPGREKNGLKRRSCPPIDVPFHDWCWFLGVWFAEGSASRGHVNLAQSHPVKSAKAAGKLGRLPFKVVPRGDGFLIYDTALAEVLKPFGRSYEKRVPQYLLDAKSEDIAAFLDGFALGDAHTQVNGSRHFYTSNPGLADDLQELMLRCGRLGIVKRLKRKTRFGTINGRPIVQRRDAYIVFERARKITGWLDSRGRREIHYTGKVYCATVSSHILFVRRNGKPVWCGNSVAQYVDDSKLAEEMLLPLEPILRTLGHRGDFAVGAMVDTKGKAHFLEFTARCGYPCWWIQAASHRGDPVQWMKDLLDGKDSLKVSNDVAIGVVMAQPDYPYDNAPPEQVNGIPIRGADKVMPDLHLVEAMLGKGPVMEDGKVVERPTYQTAGTYVCVATGLGKTVEKARSRVYATVDAVHFPNKMHRTDIGCKVIDSLDALHRHGYCLDTDA